MAVFACFKIVASFADFGFDYTMVTFVSGARGKFNDEEKNQTLKSVLCLKLIVAAVFLVLGQLFSPFLSQAWVGSRQYSFYLRLVFFALGGQLLWNFILNYFSAHKDFTKTAFFLSSMPFMQLLALFILVYIHVFNLFYGVLIYLLAPMLTAFIWWFFLDQNFLKSPWFDKQLYKNIFRFSRWIYISNVASTVRNYLNSLFLLSPAFSGSITAGQINSGLYNFGDKIAAGTITIFSESVLTVLLPKATEHQSPGELRKFLKIAYAKLVFLILPLIGLMFLVKPLFMVLCHFMESYRAYEPALTVFYILYTGALFSIASFPMRTALYAVKMPHIETVMELFMLVIAIAGGLIMIPLYGFVGAAIVVFIQRSVSFIAITVYGMKILNKMQNISG
jgi:O-antigen/teichoic acid export membrane protein